MNEVVETKRGYTMNEVVEKKTGVLRLEEGTCFPCDATLNTEETFDEELTGTIGETMYYLESECEWDFKSGTLVKMLFDESKIKKVLIFRIAQATNCSTVLFGKVVGEDDEFVSGVQELFFKEYAEAAEAVKKLKQFYAEYDLGEDWLEDYKKCIAVRYRYLLKFPVKPQDVILEDESHYVANKVVADIRTDRVEILYIGHDDISYEAGREVHTTHEFSGVQSQYEIVQLLEKKQTIIDM